MPLDESPEDVPISCSMMTTGWTTTDRLTAAQRLEVLNLLNRTEVELGREAIDEGRRRVVVHGWPGQHWLLYRDDTLASYALASGNSPVVVEVAGGGFDEGLRRCLHENAETIEWWIRDGMAAETDAEVLRTLRMLEVVLPIEVASIPSGVSMRIFESGRDNDRWLEQNNLAFADHPEQGTWSREDLEMRIAEPWFDPSGFLLFESEEVIVASCWTKVHELHPDRVGEIYVISVLPAAQGRGLGRVAATQGLNTLRRKGVSRAVLFVDDSNLGALALYGDLGFQTVREDHLLRFQKHEV